jgi:hypothetical protein
MAAPLANKHAGDTSENKANQDAGLAEELGMPKKTFEKYKYQARELVERFVAKENARSFCKSTFQPSEGGINGIELNRRERPRQVC